jgi:hypothetical protein
LSRAQNPEGKMKLASGALTREAPADPSLGPQVALVASFLFTVALLIVLPRQLSPVAVLPVLTVALFLMACGAALLALIDRARKRRLTYWDVTGLLTFAGICLAAAVEPEQLVSLVETGPRAE